MPRKKTPHYDDLKARFEEVREVASGGLVLLEVEAANGVRYGAEGDDRDHAAEYLLEHLNANDALPE